MQRGTPDHGFERLVLNAGSVECVTRAGKILVPLSLHKIGTLNVLCPAPFPAPPDNGKTAQLLQLLRAPHSLLLSPFSIVLL